MLRIATRNSPLALYQAEFVAAGLRRTHPQLRVELLPMTTEGDRRLSGTLVAVGGKGLFVKELEQALLEGRAEAAVHSMKDVPAQLPAGLCITALLAAEDPRDALVSRHPGGLAELPQGARVGTASLRRRAQLLRLRPDLRPIELRGNLGTRLRRLDAGEIDALILAHAGLARLGLTARISQTFEPELMLPAIAQGVIGIETRVSDEITRGRLSVLHDSGSALRLAAERALGARLGGACTIPVAGHAVVHRPAGSRVSLTGLVAAADGSRCVRGAIEGAAEDAAAVGIQLAERLLESGGREILAALGVRA
ncbi:MAG: hydroxymethylbilane synthase [Gammaproteobacteria bacterium]|nr:hydroxymethylbilane synthase [Gammaproteobacteria bacterium]